MPLHLGVGGALAKRQQMDFNRSSIALVVSDCLLQLYAGV
jgi:hypothetical protein